MGASDSSVCELRHWVNVVARLTAEASAVVWVLQAKAERFINLAQREHLCPRQAGSAERAVQASAKGAGGMHQYAKRSELTSSSSYALEDP